MLEVYLFVGESAGFRSQLQESIVSSHTKELWYNETVCLWMTIYRLPYPSGVEFSSEGGKARLFEWIELSVAVKRISVNKTNVIHKRLKFLRLR